MCLMCSKRFVSMAERQFSTKLKTVQTDWGVNSEIYHISFPLLVSFTVSLALTPANKMVSSRDVIVMLSKPDSLSWHNLMSLNGSGTLPLKPQFILSTECLPEQTQPSLLLNISLNTNLISLFCMSMLPSSSPI